jgi:hypothetical protein
MTRKTQKIVYGLFVFGICIAFSAAMSFGTWGCQPTSTEQNGSTEGKVDDVFWRTTIVNGCMYIVPVYGYDAITHAGNCPNHDTTKKD